MDGKIAIRKQWEGDVVCFPEIVDLEIRIADADADQLDFSLELGIFFQLAKHLVDSGSLPLTVRSVHAENLDDDHLGFDIWDRENGLLIQAEVLAVIRCLGNRQFDVRQDPTFRWRLVGGG